MTGTRRILVAVVGFALAAQFGSAHELPTEPSVTECGGTAPETTSCTTGTHRSWWPESNVFMWIVGDYVGTLEYRIEGDGFRYVARWDVRADGTTTFEEHDEGIGLALLPYSQSCHSFQLETSIPGGTGEWGCHYGHEFGA